MNFDLIKFGLSKLVDATEALMPATKLLNSDAVNSVTKIIESGLSIANNVTERVKETKVVLKTNDENELKAIISRLEHVNDLLAQEIEAS